MEKNYLIIAEQISYRNNKLSAVNIWDQFIALQLPAKFNFDLAFICGPGWQAGKYNLTFKVKSQVNEPIELGSIMIDMINEKSVFNATASGLNFMIQDNTGEITFIVERNGDVIFERDYPVNCLIERKTQPEPVEA